MRLLGKAIVERKELSLEERRERRRGRREKQRAENHERADKMHTARMAAPANDSGTSLTSSAYVGCSGWFYWKWRGQFYPVDMPTSVWFSHYAEQFDTVEINASFYSWPTVANVKSWLRQPGEKDFVYTDHPHQEVRGSEDARQRFRNDRRYPWRSNGLLPVSTAAKLSLHRGAAARHS